MVYDVITIGSGTIDIFLKTKSKDIDVEEVNSHKDICMPIGMKILIDELVTDTGGGGTNTGVAFSKMGFKTGWIGKLGKDIHSKTIMNEMKEAKVDFLGGREEGHAGLSVILTGFDKNRTILAYKGINDKLKYSEVKKAKTKWYYMASMKGESWKTAVKIAKDAKGTPLAFNPSMYTAKEGMKKLKPVLEAAKVLILNKEESQALSGKKKEEEVLKKLQDIVPILVVTDGSNGAVAYNGIKKYRLTVPKVKPLETTGAGDSFASAFVASLIKKEDIPTALLNGHKQAESVIMNYGAKNNLLGWKELKKKRTKAKVKEC